MANSGSYAILPSGIAADSSGDAYIVGFAAQAGFPTTSGAYQTTCNGYGVNGGTDTNCFTVFIAKLNPAGTALLAGTYFGCATCSGDSISGAGAVVLDAQNNVWLTGYGGNSLRVVNGNASDNTNGGEAPFIATFNSTLSTLSFMTFVSIGNAGQGNVDGLALDGSGGVYLAGSVNNPANSAATSGAFSDQLRRGQLRWLRRQTDRHGSHQHHAQHCPCQYHGRHCRDPDGDSRRNFGEWYADGKCHLQEWLDVTGQRHAELQGHGELLKLLVDRGQLLGDRRVRRR